MMSDLERMGRLRNEIRALVQRIDADRHVDPGTTLAGLQETYGKLLHEATLTELELWLADLRGGRN